MNRPERFERLYAEVRGCERCPLAATRTCSVPGEGNINAEVMFIGEAPGANEDKQGRPFVGAAGQFLDELLGHAGLDRSSAYICNVLKCRPPNNRDPLPDEIEACRDYLDEQIDLIDPLVIVTLGRYSMARYFPKQTISRIHGTVKEVAGRFYVPMYHPAAALHQGGLRQVIIEDFRKLPGILQHARRAAGAPVTPGLAPPPPAAPVAAARPAAAPPPPVPDDVPWEYEDGGDVEFDDWRPPPPAAPLPPRESGVTFAEAVASAPRDGGVASEDRTPPSPPAPLPQERGVMPAEAVASPPRDGVPAAEPAAPPPALTEESTAPGPTPSRTPEPITQPQIRLFD